MIRDDKMERAWEERDTYMRNNVRLVAEIERLQADQNLAAMACDDLNQEVERLKAKIVYVRQRSQRACEILNEFDATEAKMKNEQPHLGLATTRELLDELRARIEMHALGGLDYRTVDGEKITSSRSGGLQPSRPTADPVPQMEQEDDCR